MKTTAEERRRLIGLLTATLEDGRCRSRSDILDAAMRSYGLDLSAAELTHDPTYNTLRSYLGVMLNELVRNGDIVRCEDGYMLVEEEPVVVERQACRAKLLELLDEPAAASGEQVGMTRQQLYAALGRHFGTDRTYSVSDDNALKGMAGQLLSRLVADNTVELKDGRYRLRRPSDPADYRRVYADEDAFRRIYIDRLHGKGGRFFESFCANLLEKYFTVTGRRVLSCDVIGGSEDGGVDIELRTQDDLGFIELVMVQVKCRANVRVTERDVREFFGAMTARGGTRGIYLTLGSFHAAAQRLLDSIPNCVGVDGDRMFRLALLTGYGMQREEGGFAFDEMIWGDDVLHTSGR